MALMLECATRSEVGRRANNEDAVYASPRLAAVADGVGGAAAGEVASQWIIQSLVQLDKCRLGDSLDVALERAIAWGNQTIRFVADCRPELAGMSTTLTAIALTNEGSYVLANIGDSRTYLLRDGALLQMSRDDSFVQHLMDAGHLTAEQARRHPSRSLVLQALDGDPERRPAIRMIAARIDDRLLLCSDGLSDVIDHSTLQAVLVANASRSDCADELIERALEAGARDNVSAIVIDVIARPDRGCAWPAPLGASPRRVSAVEPR
jgi:serine/threonine protein phosphatase PrpC